jgi:phenylacetate-CoA ligase
MVTHPSWVRILAKEIKETNVKGLKIDRIFTSGEMLDENTRELARDVLGAEIFDGYGANEVGGICTQCSKVEGYHIWSDSVLVEILKDGQPVSVGEKGEVVVTNLTNCAMPFLRYNLEEFGILLDGTCACGNCFPLMKPIDGRKSDVIWAGDGSSIPALEVYHRLIPIEGIKQFQLIQQTPDKFVLKVVPNRKRKVLTLEKAGNILRRCLGDVRVEFQVVEDISKEISGKSRAFISDLTTKE